MEKAHKKVLIDLGYDVDSRGFVFFEDLVEDVRGLLTEGYTDEDIIKVLPSHKLEYYHFYYEVGKTIYTDKLNKFCSSCQNKKDNKLPFMDVDTTIIYFSKMFNEMDSKQKSNKKLVKKTDDVNKK